MTNVLALRRRPRGARSKVESRRVVSRAVGSTVHLEVVDSDGRPLTRGDCAAVERPCAWVSCSHNLYLDVTDAEGIKFNFPDVDPDGVPPESSCALDVADRGGSTLADVAAMVNLTRERVRQIEVKALERLRVRSTNAGACASVLREFVDGEIDDVDAIDGVSGREASSRPRLEDVSLEDDEDDAEPLASSRVSFFAEPDDEDADELVAASVWRMFARDSNARGFSCRSRASIAASEAIARRRSAGDLAGPPEPPEEDHTMSTDGDS